MQYFGRWLGFRKGVSVSGNSSVVYVVIDVQGVYYFVRVICG